MKKVFLTVLAVALVAVTAVQAQKVNKSALVSKIEKSDADIADAKKGAKAATWINRGKAFYEAAIEPTKSLFVNMDAAMLKLAVGEPASTESVTLVNVPYEAWVYPWFTAYIKDGKIATWSQTQWVIEDAPAKAIEAYNKAYEMAPKTADKVKEGLKQISDFCSQVGNTGIDTGNYADAADAYALAFEAQSSPAHGNPEPALLYYAGYLRTVDGAANPASYVIGADYLNKALDLGYNDEEGNIYYYLFHCYYGQKDADKANVLKAKDALVAGIKKFPKNERILDGLVQLYTNPEDSVGDPADLVALIDAAIESNPENVDLWFGRGRIFFALKQYDESIASFQKVVELKPDLFEGNYYLGVFYTIKADEMNKVMNEKQYSSQAAYDADLKAANAVYMEAIPWFEKAHELKADDFNTLDMLKQLCFRLRDEPGIQEKYDTYFPLWKAAKGE
ncbi:tetratricopeptide repeat protein [Alistipes finegoldii]|uniref:tetratricopeptide repeat protein n=1 Tax=Alistipes finegoldii TaxID=214856 RepID=UPI00242CAB28|nr:tetratricopeptide repeat protein [Alistipes finegoldii]